MRCPALSDLPSAPLTKTGWPWTVESPQLPETMPDGSPWPRVSIVTPSYNQAQFIEETIRSVLLQGYPNLEYIIMDGGSNDGSVEIIRKYEPWLASWLSERDDGQSHAINKGMLRATGAILAFINSDDYYLPDVLSRVACEYVQHPQSLIAGDCYYVNEHGKMLRLARARHKSYYEFLNLFSYEQSAGLTQPGVFWDRDTLTTCGMFREDLYYSFDYEYWLRALANGRILHYPDAEYACSRFHGAQKTANKVRWYVEDTEVAREYVAKPYPKLQHSQIRDIYRSIDWWLSEAYMVGMQEAICAGEVGKAIGYTAKGISSSPRHYVNFTFVGRVFSLLSQPVRTTLSRTMGFVRRLADNRE